MPSSYESESVVLVLGLSLMLRLGLCLMLTTCRYSYPHTIYESRGNALVLYEESIMISRSQIKGVSNRAH